jgi:hypothetical protein
MDKLVFWEYLKYLSAPAVFQSPYSLLPIEFHFAGAFRVLV